jgi:uncharacterized protein YukE
LAKNNHHHHHSWWDYLYDRMESVSRSLSTLSSRVTGRLDSLSRRVDQLAATVAGQANSSLAAKIDQLASDLTKVSSDLALLSTKLEPMNAKLEAMNTTLESKLAEYGAGWATLSASVVKLDGDFKKLDGMVSGLAARIDGLEQGGTAGGGGRTVIDSNGKKIGDFAGLDPISLAPLVAMSDDSGRSFVLQVYPNRLKGELYFTNAGCTGTPVVPRFTADPNSSISLAGVRNMTVYVTNANVASDSFLMVHSAATDQAPDFCEDVAPTAVRVLPVTSQIELVAVPPFLVK